MSAIRERSRTGARWLVLAASVLATSACRAEDVLSFPKPDSLSMITPGNAGKLRMVGHIGAPVVEEVAWSPDGTHLGLRSAEGISLYRHDSSKKPSLARVAVVATDRSPLSFSFRGRGDRVLTCNGGRVVTIWPLAPGAAPEEVHVDAGVRAVAFSPAAGVLAAVTDDGKLRIWRDEDLKEAPDVLDDHENGAAGISIAAGGKLAVTWAGWNDARVWNLETGTRVMDVTTRSRTSSGILDPAWVGPDGALWANVPGKTARWSIPSAERMPEFPARLALGPGCFSPDGKKCVARTDDGLGLAAVQDGRTLLPLVETEGFAVAAFEPVQGKLLALCADGKLSLCDAKSGASVFSENRGPPTRILGTSRDSRWLLCGAEGQDLTLVDLRAAPKVRKLRAPGADVLDAVLDSTPSCVITRSPFRLNEPSRLAAWTFRGAQLRPAAPLEVKGEVRSFDLSPTGKLLALATNSPPTLELLSTESGKPRTVLPLKVKGDGNTIVSDVVFHPGGKTVAAALTEFSGILLVNVDDGKVVAELPLPEGFDSSVMRIAFDSAGKLLGAATLEDGAFVCDIESKRVVAAFRSEGWRVDALDFSPDSKLFASAISQQFGFKTASRIEVFDLVTGIRVFERQAHTNTVDALRFVQKGKLLASSDYGGSIRLWGIDGEKRADPPEGDPKK